MCVQFSVLGPLEMRSGQRSLPIRRGRPRLLVHVLLLNRRVSVPLDVIADKIWGEEAPSDAANAVHQLVSYLRGLMGPGGRDLIVTTPTGYQLDAADDQVDSWQFEALVHSAIAGIATREHATTLQGLNHAQAALKLWRGEPFAESAAYDWSAGDRARLQNTYLQAQESRLAAMLQLGRHREVVLESQSLATAYPLREEFHAQLVLALYRSGRQADALEVHRVVRELLATELGIDPGTHLQELEQRILRQDPSLDWTPPPGAAAALSDSRSPPGAREASATTVADRRPVVEKPKVVPLPSWPTRLFGRENEVEVVRRLLAEHRLISLTGPGGVGKSRLALQVAATLDETPTWFVDLSDIDTDEVDAAIVDRLGLLDETRRSPQERLDEAFAGTDGLLILDTCEHVVTAVAELVMRLSTAAPHLRLVATSLRPLGVQGEVVHQLRPLPVPTEVADAHARALSPAVQLFEDRARLVRAEYHLDEHSLADVVEIVRVLDGLPVAIELAAAHADVLSAAQIAQRIAGHLEALVSDNVGLPPRQRSLRAAIEASTVRMTDTERTFFLALAIFPGPFDIDAAAAVSDITPSAAYPLIAALVRQSMVSTDGTDRYRLLGPIRAYARAQLTDHSQFRELRRRHVDWVSAFAGTREEVSPGAARREELNVLRELLPDARVALQSAIADQYLVGAAKVAIAFSWVWTLHGLASEGLDWLESVRRLTSASGVLDPDEQKMKAAVLRSLGLLANPVGRLELARDVCAEAAELSAELGDQVGEAAALLTLGIAQWALGDLDRAAGSHDRAAQVMASEPESWHYLAAKVLRSRTAMDRNEPGFAERIQEAVALLQPSNEQQMLGLAISFQARYLLRLDDFAMATVTAEEALRVWRSITYTEGEMSALNILARALVGQGELVQAEQMCLEALATARTAGHRGALVESVESLAQVAAAQGRREHALLLLSASVLERQRTRNPLPAPDRERSAVLEQEIKAAVGGAAPLITARAQLTRFDELVDQLLAPH
jgi:predicted ATPase/DNA-binding SARP family transcriptional activator